MGGRIRARMKVGIKTATPILMPANRKAPQPGGNSPTGMVSPSSMKRFQRTKKIVPNTRNPPAWTSAAKARPSRPPPPSTMAMSSAPTRIAKGSQARSIASRVFSMTTV